MLTRGLSEKERQCPRISRAWAREQPGRPGAHHALPSFVARWLVPRLTGFRALHPGIDLHITSEVAVHDFARDGFDLAIRLGLGRWPGLQADLISRERLSPVCSPALLAQAPLATVGDLQAHTLLHDQPGDLWPRWLALAGASRSEAEAIVRAGPGFSDSALVLQAAAEGHGVALGRMFLASADITAGRLVKPLPWTCPMTTATGWPTPGGGRAAAPGGLQGLGAGRNIRLAHHLNGWACHGPACASL